MWIIHRLSVLSELHCEIRISNKCCNFFNPINTENVLRLNSTIKIITLFFCFTTDKLNTVLNFATLITFVAGNYCFNQSSNIYMKVKNTHEALMHLSENVSLQSSDEIWTEIFNAFSTQNKTYLSVTLLTCKHAARISVCYIGLV